MTHDSVTFGRGSAGVWSMWFSTGWSLRIGGHGAVSGGILMVTAAGDAMGI